MVALVFVFMLLPILYVVLSSFADSASVSFPPKALSLHWYGAIEPSFWAALRLSLIVAGITTVIAAALGTGIALAIARWRGPGRTAFSAFSLSPLMIPPLVIGAALLQFSITFWGWTGFGLMGTWSGIIAGHVALTIPLVIRSVLAAHAHFDASIEEAALNLGATPRQAFFHVTIRGLMPGIT
jgi:putative spermidine/putrescine transport system permease protein